MTDAAPRFVDADGHSSMEINITASFNLMPPLLKGYLRLEGVASRSAQRLVCDIAINQA